MPLRRKNDDSKPSPKTKEPQKRRSRPDHDDDDDSSQDSHGNIRDLIEYDTDESETLSSSWRQTSSSESPGQRNNLKKRPPRRKAAVAAEKNIKSKLEADEKRKLKWKAAEEEESPKKSKRKMALTDSESEDEKPQKKSKRKVVEESEDEKPQKKSKRKVVEESEEEEDEEEEEEDEDDGSDDDSEEEEEPPRRSGIELLISDFGGGDYRPQKPKKYKLSKEPENVRRFVKLVQTEIDPEEEDIDRDIGYFKGLSPGAQDKLLTKLHTKVEPAEPPVPLKFQIMSKEVPAEVERVAMSKYQALMNIDPSSTEYYKASQWLHGYTQLPLGVYKDLPVKIEDGSESCQEFMTGVAKCMETAIYGHDEAKLQIMQFVSSWIANPQSAGNVLSIHGPPGVGKTTLIKDGVAKALGRPFHFITLGGATDASFLDGHSYTYEGSTWGRIVDVLIKSKCMNPVIYFDELDKVSDTPKGEEINNLLIHLTDGSQNDRFQDKYFTGIDLNLSRCLFIFSHNDHSRVNPILRDRMYNIQVEGFGLKEKLVIAEQYLVSQALREVNLFEKIGISKEILTHIIEDFTGEEKGVRELKRCIQTMISKINLLRFYNDPAKVPFSIKGFTLPFTVKKEHVELFMKKKAAVDQSIQHLYT
jgi:flagellar biosynthesis GTPase FlhF